MAGLRLSLGKISLGLKSVLPGLPYLAPASNRILALFTPKLRDSFGRRLLDPNYF